MQILFSLIKKFQNFLIKLKRIKSYLLKIMFNFSLMTEPAVDLLLI